MGNLRSVQKALESVGATATITQKVSDLKRADKIVLPGVGAMQPAMKRLSALKLIEPIKKAIQEGKPFLGICLGLQLLFETSQEGGAVKGLGIIKGKVKKFKSSLKVPHMGWNQLNVVQTKCPLLNNIKKDTNVYFCHSYFVAPKEKKIIAATTDYGIEFASAICRDNVFGVQFHPEKSQLLGLKILENFVRIKT